MRFYDSTASASKTVTSWTVEETLKPDVRMFQTFYFNHIITDLSFLYIKNDNYKAGLTRIRAFEHLRKFCEHEQTNTRAIFASNSSKGQILRALLKWMTIRYPKIWNGPGDPERLITTIWKPSLTNLTVFCGPDKTIGNKHCERLWKYLTKEKVLWASFVKPAAHRNSEIQTLSMIEKVTYCYSTW